MYYTPARDRVLVIIIVITYNMGIKYEHGTALASVGCAGLNFTLENKMITIIELCTLCRSIMLH